MNKSELKQYIKSLIKEVRMTDPRAEKPPLGRLEPPENVPPEGSEPEDPRSKRSRPSEPKNTKPPKGGWNKDDFESFRSILKVKLSEKQEKLEQKKISVEKNITNIIKQEIHNHFVEKNSGENL